MTNITTAVTPIPKVSIFSIPGGTQPYSIVPRATVEYFSSITVPAKLAADQSQALFTLNLPENFVYRISEIRAWAQSAGSSDFADFSSTMRCLLSGGIGGTVIFGLQKAGDPGNSGSSYPLTFTSATTDVEAQYALVGSLPGALVQSTQQVTGKLEVRWMDVSADATAIMTPILYVKFLQYDVDQATKFPIHTPVPVIS